MTCPKGGILGASDALFEPPETAALKVTRRGEGIETAGQSVTLQTGDAMLFRFSLAVFEPNVRPIAPGGLP